VDHRRPDRMPRARGLVKSPTLLKKEPGAPRRATMLDMKASSLMFLMLAAACSSGSPAVDAGSDGATDGSKPNASCTFDYDCASAGQRCFFPIDGHCTVAGQTGTCMDFQEPDACQPNVSCGCDGTTISVCAPAGYVDRSSNFSGPCPAPEAGPVTDGSADATPE